jgi:hypothetical protein
LLTRCERLLDGLGEQAFHNVFLAANSDSPRCFIAACAGVTFNSNRTKCHFFD